MLLFANVSNGSPLTPNANKPCNIQVLVHEPGNGLNEKSGKPPWYGCPEYLSAFLTLSMISSALLRMLFTILGRRAIEFRFETLPKIIRVGETRHISDFVDVEFFLKQQLSRPFESDFLNDITNTEARQCFHFSIQLRTA